LECRLPQARKVDQIDQLMRIAGEQAVEPPRRAEVRTLPNLRRRQFSDWFSAPPQIGVPDDNRLGGLDGMTSPASSARQQSGLSRT